MSLPLISIIVPCYNKEKYISNCLNSLKCQTYDNLQLILVDDCSTDGTKKILEEFVNKAPNAELHLADGKGVSHARNLGISLARGKYLTFLDADDFISPYHVETLFNALVTTESDLAVCRYKRVGENSVFSSKHFKKIKEGKKTLFDKDLCMQYFLSQKKFDFCVWNKLYRTDIIMQNNIRFLEACKHTEDTYFNYLYIKHIKKCVFVNNKTHYYVQSKNSLVRQKFSELRLDMFLSLDEIVNDSYKNYPQMIDYAHAIRAIMTCEILFFLKFSKYRNPLAVNKLLKYIKEDSKHLKRCSQVPLYRRLLVPLVPTACKIFLCKRLGESIDGYSLPDNFKN